MTEITWFRSHFQDAMPMLAPPHHVADYLDDHPSWFKRCAQPMGVLPIGRTGYALRLGRFGALGYEVEPQIGLDLLPQDQQVYRICTIPVPDYQPQGYEVDFQAQLALVEAATVNLWEPRLIEKLGLPAQLTQVDWHLDLTVGVQFPAFIHALPAGLIHTTGEGLLRQVVKQISRRLTRKVQEDFHQSQGLPFPRLPRPQRSTPDLRPAAEALSPAADEKAPSQSD